MPSGCVGQTIDGCAAENCGVLYCTGRGDRRKRLNRCNEHPSNYHPGVLAAMHPFGIPDGDT
eukprot:2157729-Pyramimonas_sp.AAC.3